MRELVKTCFPQEGAEFRDTRVFLELEVCLPFGARLRVCGEILLEHSVRVAHHGLEFVAGKKLAAASDALVGKDDMSPVIHGNDECQEKEQRGKQESAEDRADEIKATLIDAVAPPGEVVAHAEHEDLLSEERLRVNARERRADEVGDEEDVAHMWLDVFDEMLQPIPPQAWRRNDDRLHSRPPDKILRVRDVPIKQVVFGKPPRYRRIVDDTLHAIAAAKVAVIKAKYALRCLSRADEDDRLIKKPYAFHELERDVAFSVDKNQRKKEKRDDEEARCLTARRHQKKDEDPRQRAVNERIENAAHHVDHRPHLLVGMRLKQKKQGDAGNPDIEIGRTDPKRAGVNGKNALYLERHILRKQNRQIIERKKKQWIEVATASRKARIDTSHGNCSSISCRFTEYSPKRKLQTQRDGLEIGSGRCTMSAKRRLVHAIY